MFVIFKDGEFYSFWQNSKSDNWAAKTVGVLKINKPSIYWYEGLTIPEFFRFDNDKNLIVQSKVISMEPSIIEGQPDTEVISFEDTELIYISEAYLI